MNHYHQKVGQRFSIFSYLILLTPRHTQKQKDALKMSSPASKKALKNCITHEDQIPEAKQKMQKTARHRRYSLFSQQREHQANLRIDTILPPFKEEIPPPLPPKHPGRSSSDGQKRKTRGSKRISPLASPARAHIPSPTLQYSNSDSGSISTLEKENENPLPAPPPSPKPYLSKSAHYIFGLDLERRPPLGLNIQPEYLDETATSFTFLELQDTINRTYGTDFDTPHITFLISNARERENLVEIGLFVYRFDMEDHHDKMAKYIKERAIRKKEGMEDGKIVGF